MMPTAEEVRQHQEQFPLNEYGDGLHDGLVWEHGACWLCRKPMLCSTQRAPSIARLREVSGVVELCLGWAQWVPLDTMPWAARAEWEPVDERGLPLKAGGMRLYFWAHPHKVNYGGSMVFAVAASEEEARQIVTDPGNARSYSHGEFLQNCLPLNAPKLGPPTRVVDLPCAEWHEWSE